MDTNKYVMLKATLAGRGTISIGRIKNDLKVETEEAEEMLNQLIQEGLVEAYSLDGTNFVVKV